MTHCLKRGAGLGRSSSFVFGLMRSYSGRTRRSGARCGHGEGGRGRAQRAPVPPQTEASPLVLTSDENVKVASSNSRHAACSPIASSRCPAPPHAHDFPATSEYACVYVSEVLACVDAAAAAAAPLSDRADPSPLSPEW